MTVKNSIERNCSCGSSTPDIAPTWTPEMTMEQVLEIWTPAKLADVLDTSVQNICGWLREGRIPRGRQYELQVKSGGRLIAIGFDPGRDYVAGGRQRKRA